METNYHKILQKLEEIKPVKYSSTRNYINGDVSRLSPYISRGVISTKQVLKYLIDNGYDSKKIEKFVQELAWRDYWQLVWVEMNSRIDSDLKQKQVDVDNHKLPKSILDNQTQIEAIDKGIQELYQTGYMHNHMRMYVASLSCNVAKSHWLSPAKWMYYYLLDADWGSNALSWQWVAGSNSNKKYYANQENINRYCGTKQVNTFLDCSYDQIINLPIPSELSALTEFQLKTALPKKEAISLNSELPTAIYNFYNLDPLWRENQKLNRILLLEPSVFNRYPISSKSLKFMLELSKNISEIQLYVGEFDEFVSEHQVVDIYYKEHPLNNYSGTQDERDWMFNVKGYYPSFFKFWNKAKKTINLY